RGDRDLEIHRHIRRPHPRERGDLGGGRGLCLDHVDRCAARAAAWTVEAVEIGDARNTRLDVARPRENTQVPARTRTRQMRRGALLEFLEASDRDDEPVEHPAILVVRIAGEVAHGRGHVETRRRKETGIVDKSGRERVDRSEGGYRRDRHGRNIGVKGENRYQFTRRGYPIVNTIFPMWSDESMRRCAATACSSGNV